MKLFKGKPKPYQIESRVNLNLYADTYTKVYAEMAANEDFRRKRHMHKLKIQDEWKNRGIIQ